MNKKAVRDAAAAAATAAVAVAVAATGRNDMTVAYVGLVLCMARQKVS